MFHTMGPFGDYEDAEVVGDVVEGEVTHGGQQEPVLTTATPEQVAAGRGIVILKFNPPADPQQPPVPIDITDEFLAVAVNQKARSIALFLEVPFLAYLALTPQLPGLVRMGAAVLGVMRTLEVTERQAELEQYLNEFSA